MTRVGVSLKGCYNYFPFKKKCSKITVIILCLALAKPIRFHFNKWRHLSLFITVAKATNMVTLAVNQNEKGRLYLRSLRKNAVISWLLFKREKEEQILFS